MRAFWSPGNAPKRASAPSVAATLGIPLGAAGMTAIGCSAFFIGSSLALAAGVTIYLAIGDAFQVCCRTSARVIASRLCSVLLPVCSSCGRPASRFFLALTEVRESIVARENYLKV